MTLTRVWTYQIESGEALRFCRISPSGCLVCFGGYDNAINLIRIQDRCKIWKIKRSAPTWSCSWSMNSSQVVICGMDKKICVIEVNTGIVTVEIPLGQWLYCIDWSSDSIWVAAGGMGPPAPRYQEGQKEYQSDSVETEQNKPRSAAIIIDVSTSQMREVDCIDAHTVWCLRYSPDAQCLALGTSGTGIYILAPNGLSMLFHVLRKTEVRALAFTADSTTLAVACLDGTVCVIDWQYREIVYEVHAGGPAVALDFVGHQGDLLIGRWFELHLTHLDLVQGGALNLLSLDRVPNTPQEPQTESTPRSVNSLSAVSDLHVHPTSGLLAYVRTDGLLVAVPLLLPPPLGAYVLAFRLWSQEYAAKNSDDHEPAQFSLETAPQAHALPLSVPQDFYHPHEISVGSAEQYCYQHHPYQQYHASYASPQILHSGPIQNSYHDPAALASSGLIQQQQQQHQQQSISFQHHHEGRDEQNQQGPIIPHFLYAHLQQRHGGEQLPVVSFPTTTTYSSLSSSSSSSSSLSAPAAVGPHNTRTSINGQHFYHSHRRGGEY